jgi:hypothetical protein
MRESALTFVIDVAELRALPYCRQEHDERGLVPHLTVLYPWLPAPLSVGDIDSAARVVAGTGPIEVRFDRLEGRWVVVDGVPLT